MARRHNSTISARSRLRGPSLNPAEGPGPDVGLLLEEPPEGPRLVLVYLPGLRALTGTPEQVARQVRNDPWPLVLGYLRLAHAPETIEDPRERRCGDVYIVRSSWAQPGWGPLLYDAALAVAGGRGVVPDRSQVSSDAERLWWHYRDKRADVGAQPLPRDCPLHGVRALDAVYTPRPGFPQAALERLGGQMEHAIAEESRALGLSQDAMREILADGAIEAAGVALVGQPPAVIRRAVRVGNPAIWMEGTMPKQRKTRNKKGFWEKTRDWDEVLLTTPEREVTRREIRDYYDANEDTIFPFLKDQTVMVLFAPSKDYFLYKRHVPGPRDAPKKLIKITKRKGIEDPSSFEYWINRRVIEFHRVIGAKTQYIWVDIDPHPRDHDPHLIKTMETAVPRIVQVMRRAYPKAKLEVWSSGKRGIHVEGFLPKPVSTDQVRKVLRKGLDAEFAGDPMFVTGIARPGQIRLDVTTLKRTGSLRAPYSYSVAGRPKSPYAKREPGLVARWTAKIKKTLGVSDPKDASLAVHTPAGTVRVRAASDQEVKALEKAMARNPTPEVVEEINRRADTFRALLSPRMGRERYTVKAEVIPGSKKVAPFYALTVEVEVPREHQCTAALCGAGKGPIDRCERTVMEVFQASGLDDFLEFDGTDYGPICPEERDCPVPERGYHFYERRPLAAAQLPIAANPGKLKRRLLR